MKKQLIETKTQISGRKKPMTNVHRRISLWGKLEYKLLQQAFVKGTKRIIE
jgi:hypothetical protein